MNKKYGKLWNCHLPWLLLGIAVPVAAAMLVVIDGERVGFAFLADRPFPTLCSARRVLGIDCPGCGMTRSIVFLVHGRFAESLAIHRCGWLLFALVVTQVPLRIWYIRRGNRNPVFSTRTQTLFWVTLVLLLFLNWVWNLISGF